MNYFSKESLAELDNPSRLFRETITDCMSPTKLKSKEQIKPFSFLNKREMMEIDDFPHFQELHKDAFFIQPIAVTVGDNQKKPELETYDTSKKIDEISPISVKAEPHVEIHKFKRTRSSPESVVKKDYTSTVHRNPETCFLSDEEMTRKITSPAINPKIEPFNKSKSLGNETLNITVPEIKTSKHVFQSRAEPDSPSLMKKKKPISFYNDRNQLKSRINKVNSFWKGTNNFIPSVFRLVNLQQGTKNILIEYQDFSLKGLCHMGHESNDYLYESKLSKQLDQIGEQYFYEDVDFGYGNEAIYNHANSN